MIRNGNNRIPGNEDEEFRDIQADEPMDEDDDLLNHDPDDEGYQIDQISQFESQLRWFRERIALPENESNALETKLDQRHGYLHELISRYQEGSLIQEQKEELEKIMLSSSYYCQRLLTQFKRAISTTPKNNISNLYINYNDRFTVAYFYLFKAIKKININKYNDKSWKELVMIITGIIKNIVRNDQKNQYFRRNNEFIEEDIFLGSAVATLMDYQSPLGKYFETLEAEEINNIGPNDKSMKIAIKVFKKFLKLDLPSIRKQLSDPVEYLKIKRQCCACLNYILICDVLFYSKIKELSDWYTLEKNLKKYTRDMIKRCNEISGPYGDLHQNEKSKIRKRNMSLVFDLNPDAFKRYNPLIIGPDPDIPDQIPIKVITIPLISLEKSLQAYCKERSLLWYLQCCRDSNPKSPKWTKLASIQRESLQNWLGSKFDEDNLDPHFMRDVDDMLIKPERLQPIIDSYILEDSHLFNKVFKQILYDYGTAKLPNRERGIDLFIDPTMPIRLTQVGALEYDPAHVRLPRGGADLQGLLPRHEGTYESSGIRRACANRIGIDPTGKTDDGDAAREKLENLISKQKGDFRKYLQEHLDWLIDNYPGLGRFGDVLSSETRKVYSSYMNEIESALRGGKIHFTTSERKRLGLSDYT